MNQHIIREALSGSTSSSSTTVDTTVTVKTEPQEDDDDASMVAIFKYFATCGKDFLDQDNDTTLNIPNGFTFDAPMDDQLTIDKVGDETGERPSWDSEITAEKTITEEIVPGICNKRKRGCEEEEEQEPNDGIPALPVVDTTLDDDDREWYKRRCIELENTRTVLENRVVQQAKVLSLLISKSGDMGPTFPPMDFTSLPRYSLSQLQQYQSRMIDILANIQSEYVRRRALNCQGKILPLTATRLYK